MDEIYHDPKSKKLYVVSPDGSIAILTAFAPAIGLPYERAAEDRPEVRPENVRAPRYKRGQKNGAKKKLGKRTVTCKTCGQQGHIAKTCPSTRGSLDHAPRAIRMDATQFEKLKEVQNLNDFSSHAFAKEYDLSIAEVNRAVLSRTFEEYQNF